MNEYEYTEQPAPKELSAYFEMHADRLSRKYGDRLAKLAIALDGLRRFHKILPKSVHYTYQNILKQVVESTAEFTGDREKLISALIDAQKMMGAVEAQVMGHLAELDPKKRAAAAAMAAIVTSKAANTPEN